MPKTKRDDLKRNCAKVYVSCERALLAIQVLHEAFAPDHPEYLEPLELMAGSLIQMQKVMRQFWHEAWRNCPDDIMKWWNHNAPAKNNTGEC